MKTHDELKEQVRKKYHAIATGVENGCCGSSEAGKNEEPAGKEYSFVGEDYSAQQGYIPGADLNLGCGLPVEHARLRPGMHVVDLGSGAGNDVFIARRQVGETGFVIGVDMTDSMIERAEANRRKLGYKNVEFRAGDIENLPLGEGEVDAVISNCVLNLVPDKPAAFSEMYRVLKPGGHFCISDIVLNGTLPSGLKEIAELYAGCVTGALEEKVYLDLLQNAGFKNIEVVKRREIRLPSSLSESKLSKAAWDAFMESDNGIFSITVTGEKS